MERVAFTVLDDYDREVLERWVLPLLGLLNDHEHVQSLVRSGVEDATRPWDDTRLARLADVCARLAERLGAQAEPTYWAEVPHADGLAAMRHREATVVGVFADRVQAHLAATTSA